MVSTTSSYFCLICWSKDLVPHPIILIWFHKLWCISSFPFMHRQSYLTKVSLWTTCPCTLLQLHRMLYRQFMIMFSSTKGFTLVRYLYNIELLLNTVLKLFVLTIYSLHFLHYHWCMVKWQWYRPINNQSLKKLLYLDLKCANQVTNVLGKITK